MKNNASIIIPCFNSEAFLTQCFPKLVTFHENGYEIIFVENGPKSSLEKQVKESLPNAKYYYLEEPNVCLARNKGIDESTRDFIQFLDVDDTIEPFKLGIQIDHMERANIDIAYSDWRYVDHHHDSVKYRNWEEGNTHLLFPFMSDVWNPIHSYLIRKKLLVAKGGFDTRFITAFEDVDIIWSAVLSGYNCQYVQGHFSNYHRYLDLQSRSNKLGEPYWYDQKTIIFKYAKKLFMSPEPEIRQGFAYFVLRCARNLAKFDLQAAEEAYQLVIESNVDSYLEKESVLFKSLYRILGYTRTEKIYRVINRFRNLK